MAKPRLLVDKPYVEIGGVKWATMNIGANSETDYGLHFQWGDTAGYTSGQCGANTTSYKKPFRWIDCVLHNGTSVSTDASFTKYNSNDGLTVLEQCDDAAAANWGGDWRMPTREEFVALGNAVTTEWVTNYNGSGVKGRLMTDKTDSSKKLFFPAAGVCNDNSVNYAGSFGTYWSSSLYSSGVSDAYYLFFQSSNVRWEYLSNRYGGRSVRPVYDPT